MGHGRSKHRIRQDEWNRQLRDHSRNINEQNEQKLRAEMEANAREVAEVARHNLATVDAELAKLDGVENEHEMKMMAWKKEVEDNENRVRGQMEEEVKAEQEKQRREFEKEAAKLEEKKAELNEARAKLLATIDEGNSKRTEMQLAHNGQTEKQRKEHAEYILTAHADLNEFRMQKTGELKQLVENGRADLQMLMDKQLELETKAVTGGQKLMDIMKSTTVHDDFRLECDNLRMRFKNFRDAYSLQESALTSTSMAMRRNKKLTNLPQTEMIYETFDALIKVVDEFKLPEEFRDKFEEPLGKLRLGIVDIRRAIFEIDDYISEYIDILEETPDNKRELEECYINTKENFGLVRTTVADLVKLIRTFDLPISDELSVEINRQTMILASVGSEQLMIAGNNAEDAEVRILPIADN